MHNRELDRGRLKRWPTLDTTRTIRYQVYAQVDTVKSHFIQSARDNVAELYDLHRFESNTEHLKFIDSHLADSRYLFPVVEHVGDGVRGANRTERVPKAAYEWP